jgi:hypothetical protein
LFALLASATLLVPLSACSDPGPLGGVPDALATGDGSSTPSFILDAGVYDAFPEATVGSTASAFADAGPYTASSGSLPLHVTDDAGHHLGASCGPCHTAGATGTLCGSSAIPCLTLGGTVYQDYKGMVPASGVEIRVVDLKGNAATTYSGPYGNFALTVDAGVTLPAMVAARDPSSTRPMVTTLATGACATAGCHVLGGSPDAGTYYPIHVP